MEEKEKELIQPSLSVNDLSSPNTNELTALQRDDHHESLIASTTSIASPVVASAHVHHIRRGAGLRFSSFVGNSTDTLTEEQEMKKIDKEVEEQGVRELQNEEKQHLIYHPSGKKEGNMMAVTETKAILEPAPSPVVAANKGVGGGGGGEEEEDGFIVEFVDDSDVWGEEEDNVTTKTTMMEELDGLIG